jgi:hypothetical protein
MRNRRARGRQAAREAELALQKEHAATEARDEERAIQKNEARLRDEAMNCSERAA